MFRHKKKKKVGVTVAAETVAAETYKLFFFSNLRSNKGQLHFNMTQLGVYSTAGQQALQEEEFKFGLIYCGYSYVFYYIYL